MRVSRGGELLLDSCFVENSADCDFGVSVFERRKFIGDISCIAQDALTWGDDRMADLRLPRYYGSCGQKFFRNGPIRVPLSQ